MTRSEGGRRLGQPLSLINAQVTAGLVMFVAFDGHMLVAVIMVVAADVLMDVPVLMDVLMLVFVVIPMHADTAWADIDVLCQRVAGRERDRGGSE